MKMKVDIVVYDPNTDNPAGAELAASLADIGLDVRWLLPEGVSKASLVAKGVDPRQVLAGPRPWTFRRVLRRLLGPFAVARQILRGKPAIVVWIHDVWDGIVLAVLAALAPDRIYFIHNNPHAVRPRAGAAAKLERLVIRRCHVIVHTEWLRDQAIAENPRSVHVVAHPNYTLTADSAPRRDPIKGRVAYVGALRRDKGSDLLVDTLLKAGGGFDFRTIGQGELSDHDIALLDQNRISYTATGRIDDAEFLAELSRVEVVIAPYMQPTESGSVLLCMAMGIPVLALESPTMRRLLNEDSRFSNTAQMGNGLARFLQNPWNTFTLTAREQRELCRHDLEVIFGGLSSPNSKRIQ